MCAAFATWHPIDLAIWRRQPGELLFRGAILRGAKLAGVNLRGEDLTGADLFDADLSGADLSGADLTDANLTGAKLREADLSGATLTGADLYQANLRDANLDGTSMRHVNLCETNLRRAQLTGADLSGSNLCGANLFEADAHGAILTGVELAGADFSGANLMDADLSRAWIQQTNFAGTIIGRTRLLNIDLSSLCDAAPSVEHYDQSYVDHDSIILSIASPNLASFLQRAGMQEVFVEYMIDCAHSVSTNVFKMLRSTFISYGNRDEGIARKLYQALHRNGVTAFFFPEHAKPGEKLHRTMKKGIAEHDRVILICSRASLDREPVLFEIEEALTREAKMKGETLLIPIRLDRYVFDEWKPKQEDLAEAVRSRVVADFEGADTDEEKFQAGLRRLIAALRK